MNENQATSVDNGMGFLDGILHGAVGYPYQFDIPHKYNFLGTASWAMLVAVDLVRWWARQGEIDEV